MKVHKGGEVRQMATINHIYWYCIFVPTPEIICQSMITQSKLPPYRCAKKFGHLVSRQTKAPKGTCKANGNRKLALRCGVPKIKHRNVKLRDKRWVVKR